MNPPRNILVRGVNWLGDAVMALPALQRLREAHPRARLTLLTPQKLNGLWTGSPFLDGSLVFSREETLWSVARRIRAGGYDLGLILPNSPRSALELRLGGVQRRIGYGTGWRGMLLTDAVPRGPGFAPMRRRGAAEIRRLVETGLASAPPPAGAHQLHHYLRLAAAAGAAPDLVAPFIRIAGQEMKETREALGIPEDSAAVPVLGLNAGAEYGPAKRWPAEHFVAAAREVRRRTGCVWVLFGGPNETGLAGEIERALRAETPGPPDRMVVNLAGRTSLRQLAAALRCCRLLLTNDTGPMHLAAAVGTRVVALFGSTSPELTGPGLPGDPRHTLLRTEVPCRPCFRRECPIDLRCLRGLSPAAVVEAALAVLAG
jgi:heptosyltransferase-2